jgi:RHS repeat-associated protein
VAIAVAAAVVASSSGVALTPAQARPTDPVDPSGAFASPDVLKPIPVTELQTKQAPLKQVGRAKSRRPVWPTTSGAQKVTGMSVGRPTTLVPGQPLKLGWSKGAQRGAVSVTAAPQDVVAKTIGSGVAWTVSGAPGSTVSAQVDYSDFADGGGAAWGSRLQLVELPACALTTPTDGDCSTQTPLATVNDSSAKTLTTQSLTLGSTGVVTLAAAAATTGSGGDFTATPLSASSSWVAGDSDGAFRWSYPLSVPPVAGSLQPSLSIDYSSNVANGRVSSSNNQPSWLGEGFDLGSAFIERRYASCADEAGKAGTNNATKTGDLCWGSDSAKSTTQTWDNATLSMAGHSGELVRVSASSSQWRLRVDDGTRVEKVSTPGATDESWKVTTPDGTQYFFGKATVGSITTNSAWKVPVAGNNSGEPGYTSGSFASSFKTVPWRWNLASVVSVNGDSMTYVYATETNKYKKNLTTVTAYDRGGYLSQIYYGTRSGSESTAAPARVSFTVAERCYNDSNLTNCETATPNSTTAYHWPDVPTDAICTGTSCTATQTAPTFFTRKRLSQVNTYVDGTNVDRWAFTASYPSPGDASPMALWLASIQHSGVSGTAITLPAVSLTPTMLANRFTNLSVGTTLTRARLGSITTESGGKITASYSVPNDCSASSLPVPETNSKACFPAYSTEGGGTTPAIQWYKMWLLSSVVEYDQAQTVDQNGTSVPSVAAAKRTTYQYGGGGAWRYDDSSITPAKYRTWGVWRGYRNVTTVVGEPNRVNEPQLVTQNTFFQGMNGDRLNAAGGKKTVTVTDSTGATWPDDEWYEGQPRETRVLTAVGGSEISGQITDPDASAATANDGHYQAKIVGTKEVRTRQTISSGVRKTRTTTTARDATYWLPTATESTGDLDVSGDETCRRVTYAAANTSAWIIGKPAETSLMPSLCTGTADPATAISFSRHFYDGSTTLGASPAKGLETRTDALTGSATRTWSTMGTQTYDQHGRVRTATDARGNTTTTTYTPATGSPVTAVAVTSPDPDGAGPLSAQTTTTTLDKRWGSTVKLVQPGGQTTQASLDSLGRVTSVWQPGRDTGASASAKYTYTVNASGVNSVKTEILSSDGSTYLPSYAIYDSFLRSRQTQTPSKDGTAGRVIVDQRYDSRGLVADSPTYIGTGTASATLVQPATANSIPIETATIYDAAARPTASILYSYGAEKWRTTTAYSGDSVSTTPPTGGTPTKTITDVFGRTTSVVQYLGATITAGTPTSTTTYAYDPAGNLATMVDPQGNTWSYTYDLQGNRLTSTDPDTGTTTRTYDLVGNVLTASDARGKGVAATYDNLNRVTKTTDLLGATLTTATYDTVKVGLPTATSRWVNGSQITSTIDSYDAAGRPTSQTVAVPEIAGLIPTQLAGSYTTTTAYNADGSVKTVGLPATGPVPAESEAIKYTSQNLPYSLFGTSSVGSYGYVYLTKYTQLGELARLSLGSTSHYQDQYFFYETASRRLNQYGNYTQSATLEQGTIAYDDAGNVVKAVAQPAGGSTDTQCYQYDFQRQLTEAWTPASGDCTVEATQAGLGGPAPYWSSWTIDKIGNTSQRVDRTVSTSATTNFTYGGTQPHFVTATSGTNGDASYSADVAGNTVSRPNGATAQTLSWNDEGKLATVAAGGSTVETNIYDAGGSRIVRDEPGRTTLYVAGSEVSVDKATGVVSAARYYTFAGRTVAVRTGATTDSVTALLGDWQNTTHTQVNVVADTVQSMWRTPFGGVRSAAGSWVGEKGFVGGTDDATGLVHIGARDYDQVLNRFITTDPKSDVKNPLRANPYLYANNSPVTMSDPSGLEPFQHEDGTWSDHGQHYGDPTPVKPGYRRTHYGDVREFTPRERTSSGWLGGQLKRFSTPVSAATDSFGAWLVQTSRSVDSFLTGRRFYPSEANAVDAEIRAGMRAGARWIAFVGAGYVLLSESADRYDKLHDKGYSSEVSLTVAAVEGGFITAAGWAGAEWGSKVGAGAFVEGGPVGIGVGAALGAVGGSFVASSITAALFDGINQVALGVG